MSYIYSIFLTKYRTTSTLDVYSDEENDGDKLGNKHEVILPSARAENFVSYLHYLFVSKYFDFMEIILNGLMLSSCVDSNFTIKYDVMSKKLLCEIKYNQHVDVTDLYVEFKYPEYINKILQKVVENHSMTLNDCEKIVNYVASKNALKITGDYYWYKMYVKTYDYVKCDDILL